MDSVRFTIGNRLCSTELYVCFAHCGVIYFPAIGNTLTLANNLLLFFSSVVLRGGKWEPEPSPEVVNRGAFCLCEGFTFVQGLFHIQI